MWVIIVLAIIAVGVFFWFRANNGPKPDNSSGSKEGLSDIKEGGLKGSINKVKDTILNRGQAAEEEEEETEEEKEKKRTIKVSDDVKVLVIDDSLQDSFSIMELIKATGANVLRAESGIKAIEDMKVNRYDVVFVARTMSRMDGVQTVRNFRKHADEAASKDTVFYAIVERESDEPLVFFTHEGINGIIRKPVGKYCVWDAICKSVKPEQVLSDEALVKDIETLAVTEKELQEAGILYNVALKNFKYNIEEFRAAVEKFADDYEEQSAKVMDSLYSGNATDYMNVVRDLRETCRKIGAEYLSDMFDDHVKMAKDNSLDVAEASFRTLELEWENTVSGINKWIGREDTVMNATAILTSNDKNS